MKLNVIKSIEGCQVHYADEEVFIYSTGLTITGRSPDGHVLFERQLGGDDLISSTIDSVPPAGRLLRRGIHSANRSRYDEHRVFVQIDDRLVAVSMMGDLIENELFQASHGRRVLRRGWCEADPGTVLIGEYWSNPDRVPARIFVLGADSAGGVEIGHTFEAGEIRHIHALDFDPFSRQVWVATGDEDHECLVGRLSERGSLAEVLGRGSQKWRTVSFAFYPEAVYWGSDNHRGSNQILRFDRESSKVVPIADVTGPVYYNASLPHHVIFSTAVEKGEGDQDRYARLYALEIPSGRIEEVRREQKDRLSPKWFGYGLFEFAEGSLGDNRFWVTAKGLEGGLRSELVELVV